jgi:mono/diheme cytochrome c family protein
VRMMIRDAGVVLALTLAVPIALAAQNAAHQHPPAHPEGGAHRHPAAAKLQNPVAANAASIAAGKQAYDKQCAGCHGDTGKGDGSMGEELNPKPANLVDADWKHGSTDGEIFVVIRDGVKNTGMKPYARKMTAHQIWNVVNYVRSIGPH